MLVTDVDEIVAPHPELGTLADYIDCLEEPYVNCLGYELIHLIDREGPFDPARRVLEQRGYWFANEIYDKPALATEPMRWVHGFHRSAELKMRPDPDLRLIHLHRMDYEICLARHRYREGRAWNERDVEQGWASHNRISEASGVRPLVLRGQQRRMDRLGDRADSRRMAAPVLASHRRRCGAYDRGVARLEGQRPLGGWRNQLPSLHYGRGAFRRGSTKGPAPALRKASSSSSNHGRCSSAMRV